MIYLYQRMESKLLSGKTKYSVGDVFNGSKRIVEYCGSHPKWRVSMWMWECIGCGTIHGPSMTATLTRKDRENSKPACCHPRNLKGDESLHWQGYEELSKTWLSSYEYNARKRGYEWSVTPEYLWKLWEDQDGKCAYTSRKLTHGIDASLDRIDNSLGYVIGNVEWVHTHINISKMAMSREDFIQMCKEVANESESQ
jgi:hypothetical protein